MTVLLCVLLYSMFSVRIVYSVQLNCTDSNYRETECDCFVECVTVQHVECTHSVQCAAELY